MTYAEAQRRQTLRCIAGAAFVAILMLLAPLRVSYGEHRYCQDQEIHRTPAFPRDSNYAGPGPFPAWYGPTGERYGFSIQEDSPIYPTLNTAERCS